VVVKKIRKLQDLENWKKYTT